MPNRGRHFLWGFPKSFVTFKLTYGLEDRSSVRALCSAGRQFVDDGDAAHK